ncbi:GNAT family N-acetyltransferase [Paenibacillus pinihumi]|uniref:GNAT family N-acetyltransferase n=1 Tax=Paenibacillus pinihumi TaxID=669462 RepID=UPI000417F734|nr:GNAT family N-acetyltransferase [Paenibacillus pinihumi]
MKIMELNRQYASKASRLVNAVFSDEEEEVFPARELEASLDPGMLRKYQAVVDASIRSFQYYIAVNGEDVLGIIGLYEMEEDYQQNDWVGWYCVDEQYRGQKVGIRLLEHVIEKARERGKANLCLYTSNHAREAKAQILYDRNHFHVTRIEPKDGYHLMYRKRVL